MTRTPRKKLKSKLLSVIVSAMLVAGLVTLGALAWTTRSIEHERFEATKQQIREAIENNALTLVTSHALALAGLVQDNAFGDVEELVANAVERDPDVVYGAFLGVDGRVWAYVTPERKAGESAPELALVQRELHMLEGVPAAERAAQRNYSAFGKDIHECGAPVIDDAGELLGHIVYGLSTARIQAAAEAAFVRSQQTLARVFAVGGVVGLVCLLGGRFWMWLSAARITAPLTELTLAANEIAGGRRGIRVNIQSGDEVESLASAFNHMLQANETALSELELTTERALAADRLKSEFLANMSHEIRTPMNGVLGMVHLIQAMPLEPKLRRYADTIQASANGLLTIINDILDFSKLEAGKYAIQTTQFDPRMVANEVTELLSSRAQEKGIEMVSRTNPALPKLVLGDPDRLRQVLNNLVGNAIKFTERGEVFMDMDFELAEPSSVTLRVSVHDTGIGIAAQDLPKLFHAFSQLDGTMVRRHGGTGLGLAISKRMCQMMGGDLDVRSELGQGSVFSFSVRCGVVNSALEPVSLVPSSRRRVLVVESNRRWRSVIEEHLHAWRMLGTLCETSEDALSMLAQSEHESTPFDAIIASWELLAPPSGELSNHIRNSPALASLPLILLMPQNAASASVAADSAFAAQLHKPFRFSDLYDALTGSLIKRLEAREKASLRPALQPGVEERVLVVDDNEINRFVVVEELSQRGYATEQARDGQEALEKFKGGSYSCVLMDCQMPVMDGYTATRAIRGVEQALGRMRTPIIALTAHALAGERERVLDAGMDDFLSKPFRPSSLEKLLKLHSKPTKRALTPPPPDVVLDLKVKRSDKLIRLFLSKVPEQLDALEQAIAHNDAAQTRAFSHKLKGSCLSLAADGMSQLAELIQVQSEKGSLEYAAERCRALRAQFAVVAGLLRAQLPEPAAGAELGKT
jgi:signal transduction histidine kinase/CheY-like chemotaxis protein